MFIACIVYVSYGVLLWIPIRSLIADIDDNRHIPPPLIGYNEGLLDITNINLNSSYNSSNMAS
jgi:hypothetical protein